MIKLQSTYIRLMMLVLMVTLSATVFAHFGGGEGTSEAPWLIETAEHLNNVRYYTTSAYSDNFFRQEYDIDLSPEALSDEDWYDQETGWNRSEKEILPEPFSELTTVTEK